jgi:hypothetical protein
MNKKQILSVIVLLAVAGGAFFVGTRFQSKRFLAGFGQQTNGNNAQGQRNGAIGRGMMGAGRPVAGEIISVDDKSVTVKMNDGSSKIVLFSDTTVINEATTVGKEKLSVGGTVSVFGTTNSDGSVTAQNIQLNPNLPSNK